MSHKAALFRRKIGARSRKVADFDTSGWPSTESGPSDLTSTSSRSEPRQKSSKRSLNRGGAQLRQKPLPERMEDTVAERTRRAQLELLSPLDAP